MYSQERRLKCFDFVINRLTRDNISDKPELASALLLSSDIRNDIEKEDQTTQGKEEKLQALIKLQDYLRKDIPFLNQKDQDTINLACEILERISFDMIFD